MHFTCRCSPLLSGTNNNLESAFSSAADGSHARTLLALDPDASRMRVAEQFAAIAASGVGSNSSRALRTSALLAQLNRSNVSLPPAMAELLAPLASASNEELAAGIRDAFGHLSDATDAAASETLQCANPINSSESLRYSVCFFFNWP